MLPPASIARSPSGYTWTATSMKPEMSSGSQIQSMTLSATKAFRVYGNGLPIRAVQTAPRAATSMKPATVSVSLSGGFETVAVSPEKPR